MIKNNYIDDPGDFNENFKMKGFEKSQWKKFYRLKISKNTMEAEVI
jgi:hypothetical protein